MDYFGGGIFGKGLFGRWTRVDGAVAIEGTGTLNLRAMDGARLDITGTGTVAISGRAYRGAKIAITGSGSMSMGGQFVHGGRVEIEGAGSVLVNLPATVHISASGSVQIDATRVVSSRIDITGQGVVRALGGYQIAGQILTGGQGTLGVKGRKLWEPAPVDSDTDIWVQQRVT
ncbi:hypothetical protein CHELA1G11_12986 [Hyphomicrobiales bacterium]|nr:hypothetical protein CHELA1G2_11324 [Hyphomicrobiales bacterium]CAH1668508.1 hypothetical protein CHELA1G11_12986 [Hyphomicrobiales bacterium]